MRPTTERVREAVFSILGDVGGARVLDLFCGTGALGLEALSRGAASAVLVDSDTALVQRNVEELELGDRAEVVRSDALRWLDRAPESSFDLVLCDPPYGLVPRLSDDLDQPLRRVLAAEGRVMVETSPQAPLELALPLARERAYGETLVRVYARGAGVSEAKPRVAVCPGSYDPVTNGHVDIITRASRVFEKVIVGVVNQPIRKQKTLFTAEERKAFLDQALTELDNVEVQVFSNLLVDFAQENGASAIVKGLRAISDFEYEFEMNQLNRKLAPEIESMYIFASANYSFLSSTGVKEMATFGGDVSDLVPDPVAKVLAERLKR